MYRNFSRRGPGRGRGGRGSRSAIISSAVTNYGVHGARGKRAIFRTDRARVAWLTLLVICEQRRREI